MIDGRSAYKFGRLSNLPLELATLQTEMTTYDAADAARETHIRPWAT